MFAHLKESNTAVQNVRLDLKKNFPGVKFSVTRDYNSISIEWTDGPNIQKVNELVSKFQTGKFDSIDDSYNNEHTEFSKKFKTARWVFTNHSHGNDKCAACIEEVNKILGTSFTLTQWLNGDFIYNDNALETMRELLEK